MTYKDCLNRTETLSNWCAHDNHIHIFTARPNNYFVFKLCFSCIYSIFPCFLSCLHGECPKSSTELLVWLESLDAVRVLAATCLYFRRVRNVSHMKSWIKQNTWGTGKSPVNMSVPSGEIKEKRKVSVRAKSFCNASDLKWFHPCWRLHLLFSENVLLFTCLQWH